MTESSHNVFVDRRTETEKTNGLATHIIYWYDTKGNGRLKNRRTNAMAITLDGRLLIARVTCFHKDQFVRAEGRTKVAGRILGRSTDNCWEVPYDIRIEAPEKQPELVARLYAELFPGDEMGTKRAFNIGKVFSRFRTALEAKTVDA